MVYRVPEPDHLGVGDIHSKGPWKVSTRARLQRLEKPLDAVLQESTLGLLLKEIHFPMDELAGYHQQQTCPQLLEYHRESHTRRFYALYGEFTERSYRLARPSYAGHS